MVTNNGCDEPTAASGKVLQGQGIGTANAFSTATYPSTATGTGKILRADGTNWVASTATYPDTAGTSGNVLTSDGTNWSSSAPGASSNTGSCLFTAATIGDPLDSTTYYMVSLQSFVNTSTSSNVMARIYVTTAFTLTKVYGAISVDGTLGSAQNCTLFIRKNDTSNTNITTTLQLTSAINTFNNTALSISLVAGDFISIGFTGPAWTTNPTSVSLQLTYA